MSEFFFPDAIKLRAYQNAGARCQCTADCSSHPNGRCPDYFWRYTEAHYYLIDPKAPADAYNCRVLCKRCLRNAEAEMANRQ